MKKSPKELVVVAEQNPIDLEAEFRASNIKEVLDKLDLELIGLKPVKTRIRETAALLLVDRARLITALTPAAACGSEATATSSIIWVTAKRKKLRTAKSKLTWLLILLISKL